MITYLAIVVTFATIAWACDERKKRKVNAKSAGTDASEKTL